MTRTREELESLKKQYSTSTQLSGLRVVELCDQLLSLPPASAPPELPEGFKDVFWTNDNRVLDYKSFEMAIAVNPKVAICIAFALNQVYGKGESKLCSN